MVFILKKKFFLFYFLFYLKQYLIKKNYLESNKSKIANQSFKRNFNMPLKTKIPS